MLKVSQLKAKITPVGRFFPIKTITDKWFEGVADDQFVSVLVMEVENERFVAICMDVIGTSEEFSAPLRERVAKAANTDANHVNIGYTHSHSAPRLGPDKNGKLDDPLYLEYVADRTVDTVERAMKQKFSEVEAYVKSYDASGYYSNRNGLDKLGDQEVKTIEFRDKNNVVKGLILAYACHSTVVNYALTRDITSDLGGYLSRGLEKRTGIYPVIMLGAAGDMSNRCTRQGNDYNELIRVGEGILARMDMKVEETKLDINQLTVTPYQFKETYVTTREMRQAQIASIKEKIANAATADLKRVFESALSHAEVHPDGGEFTMDLKGVVVRMGDLEFMTMPAELFNRFGQEIKAAMPVKCPIFWGYSNYSVGYLYYKEEAGLSFESAATNIPVGVPEQITEFCIERVK